MNRYLTLVAIVLLPALAACGGHSGGAKTDAVSGSVTIADFEGSAPDDPSVVPGSSAATSGPCSSLSGYSDIAPGASVVISDDAGSTMAITKLGSGAFNSDGACVFTFTTAVKAGKGFYGVTVTHRGPVKFAEADLGHAGLSLGGN